MYIIEVFDIKTRAWVAHYTTTDKTDARKRFDRLYNDGFNPRVRKAEVAQ